MQHIPFKICDRNFQIHFASAVRCLRQTLILICKTISFHTIYGICVWTGDHWASTQWSTCAHVEYERELIRQSVCLATKAEEYLRPIAPLLRCRAIETNDKVSDNRWMANSQGRRRHRAGCRKGFSSMNAKWGKCCLRQRRRRRRRSNKHRKLNPLASRIKYSRKYFCEIYNMRTHSNS